MRCPLTRFALDDAAHRREQIDLSPKGRSEVTRSARFNQKPSCARDPVGLALGIIAVESGLPATFLHQRKHGVDRRGCDLDEAAHFLDRGHERIDLE